MSAWWAQVPAVEKPAAGYAARSRRGRWAADTSGHVRRTRVIVCIIVVSRPAGGTCRSSILGTPLEGHNPSQWKKCRSPVKNMATPAAPTRSIDSWSRTDPPGWTMALMPAFTRISGPSLNGKYASDAATEPAAR